MFPRAYFAMRWLALCKYPCASKFFKHVSSMDTLYYSAPTMHKFFSKTSSRLQRSNDRYTLQLQLSTCVTEYNPHLRSALRKALMMS